MEDREEPNTVFFVLGAGDNSKFNIPSGLDLALRGVVAGET
jgi:hypothetical protein